MRQAWRYSMKTVIRVKRYFEHQGKGQKNKRDSSGLGQFVLLLSLTPFIFSLTLYDFYTSKDVASKYQFAPDRFDGLSYAALSTGGITLPKRPSVKVDIKTHLSIVQLTKRTPEKVCSLSKRKPKLKLQDVIPYSFALKMQKSLKKQCGAYKKALVNYSAQLINYNALLIKNKVESTRLITQADTFIYDNHIKPNVPPIDIIETSTSEFQDLLKQVALDNHFALYESSYSEQELEIPEDDEDANISELSEEELAELNLLLDNQNVGQLIIAKVASATSFQLLTTTAWLLGFILIVPSMIYCIKQSSWGLLVFGLAVPSYYYGLYVISLFSSVGVLSSSAMASPLFAQIAFIWFLLKGSLFSRTFVVFVLLLFFSTFLPLLAGSFSMIDWAYVNNDGYSVSSAQIPLLIFIVVACVGRLLVKGAKENVALLRKLGAILNLKSAAHAFVLWLPIVVLCLPFFYVTKVLIPTNVTDELHTNRILQFTHTHPQGFLDNALQSVAHKSDDINFAWHLVVEERKAQLFATDKRLQELDFEETVNKHFNTIIPQKLVFEEPNSDAPWVAWLVNMATKETQKSAQATYQKFRNEIRSNLIKLIREKEELLKEKADEGKDALIEELEQLKVEGKAIIISQNSATQTSVWWTVMYLEAAHQLALLLFIFICFKSYFYVFARVCFNKDKGAMVTLGDTQEVTSKKDERLPPSITAAGIDYIIKADEHAVYYITRRYQCRGKPPKLSLPQTLASPIARIFSSSYTMNKVVVNKGDADITCTATKGVEFFEWQLAANETIVFDYSNFVGMSEGLSLSTLISPRISSLLLGKMIFSQATGPGKLILMATGRAQVCDASENVGSMPPERIIAMQLDTKLHVDSELDIVNVYLSTAYVKPISGKMIVDVDNQRGAKNGLARFVRNFLLPG